MYTILLDKMYFQERELLGFYNEICNYKLGIINIIGTTTSV